MGGLGGLKVIESGGIDKSKGLSITEEIKLKQKLAEKEEEIVKLRNELQESTDQVKRLISEKRQLLKQIDELQRQNEKLRQEYDKATKKYERDKEALSARINDLLAEIESYKKQAQAISQLDIGDVNAETEDLVMSLLSPVEQKIYEQRKRKYLEEFELNTSSDVILLRDLLFHEILHLRLLNAKSTNPEADVMQAIEECVARIQKDLESLGMLRKQRLSQKEEVQASIADLIAQFDKEALLRQAEEYRLEEEIEKKRKAQRDKEITDYDTSVKALKQIFAKNFVKEDGVKDITDGNPEEAVK